ncbi:hypothetical protein FNW02_33895 [Komarekiella sp. 'clone 1']|uniref:Uncharacterized protein n=1 Tax=Komarekiella delphini-convector SJRDD-AB1 TaxID=2593771 RepID=A0AA40T475_9NOST|nr:hypothetical protein [Komarekiella delphini-convector]MBD6620631.1 hypothetical protein [Komarekiella delphini-convector SJRDD-AB1]
MIEDGKAKDLQRDYLDILDSIIKKIQVKAKENERGTQDIHIFSGPAKVYQASPGKDPTRNLITPETVDALQKAFSDPKNTQGSIVIKIGSEKVFQVKNQKLEVDKLGLSESLAQAQKPVVPVEREEGEQVKYQVYNIPALAEQVKELQQKVQSQESQTPDAIAKLTSQVDELAKSLERQQELIEKTQLALSKLEQRPAPSQNSKLQNWIGKIESKVKDTVKDWVDKAKDAITPETTKLKNQIEDLKTQLNQRVDNLKSEVRAQTQTLKGNFNSAVNDVKQNIDDGISNVKTEIQNTRQEFTKSISNAKSEAIDQSVKALLRHLGTKNSDGSLSYTSKSFDFQQQGGTVTVKAKNGDTVLQDGALSTEVSPEQMQALDKVQPIVDKLDAAEQSEKLNEVESESQAQSRGISR